MSDIHLPKASLAGAVEGAKKATGVGFDDRVLSSRFPHPLFVRLKDLSQVEAYVEGLPVVAFRWTDEFKQKHPHLQQRWVQTLLRARGMIGTISPRRPKRRERGLMAGCRTQCQTTSSRPSARRNRSYASSCASRPLKVRREGGPSVRCDIELMRRPASAIELIGARHVQRLAGYLG